MAYGTPSTPQDIAQYYTRIRHGRPPSDELLSDLTRRYAAIGGTSPLAERTAAQVAALAAALEEVEPGGYDVRFGSKYQPPLLEAAAHSFREDGFSRVVGLALAPHSSSLSTDQYMSRAKAALGDNVALSAVGSWYRAPGFYELMARRVLDALARVDPERHPTTEVIFSAHSLPLKILDAGDDYPEQLRESADAVAHLAHLDAYDVAWQSAGRTSDPWIGPDILAVLRDKRSRGVTDVVSCPIGFVSDHLEVLFDIDVEAQAVAREIGLHLVRTASLNDDRDFVAVLRDVVRAAAA